MKGHAKFSKDGLYRYSLCRIWENKLPKILFIMLNPSLACASKNDPTIKKLINFSKSWGFGGFHVGNLYSNISPYPKNIVSIKNVREKKNIDSIKNMIKKSQLIIYAWGNNEKTPIWLKKIVKDPYCIELSVNGVPKHPLYLKKTLKYQKIKIAE
tara:strand:+ start:908 stop:1372 length:465 start_codon:yes stop_codon:yes gene_type:complete